MTTLRDVLHLAEERAAVLRAIEMDRDRDDQDYDALHVEEDEICKKIVAAIGQLSLAQKQQLMALCDPLENYNYGYAQGSDE